MVTKGKTIVQLLEELHQAKWTDKALGAEFGISSQRVYRWRHLQSPTLLPKLVRAKLVEILERS